MKNKKLEKILSQLFKTKVGLFIVSTVLCFIFGILNNWFEWAVAPFIFFGIYPSMFIITMIVYAWIINPIRDYKENKKKR